MGWIYEKMTTQESTLGGGRFFASGSIVIGNGVSTCSDPCIPSKDYSIIVGNGPCDNAHASDLFSRGERLGREPSALVQHAQHKSGS